MANSFLSFSTLCFVIPLVFFFNSGGVLKPVNGQASEQGAWCIPKPSLTDPELNANIVYACNIVNCTLIQPGGSCFEPNNPMNHASVVMNLHYQEFKRNPWDCDFSKSGIVAISDPSYEDCKFPYNA